jgi:hypothetical protein
MHIFNVFIFHLKIGIIYTFERNTKQINVISFKKKMNSLLHYNNKNYKQCQHLMNLDMLPALKR